MNPFLYGEVVTGRDFCDRPELVGRLRRRLESGRNTAIVGERRTGKTSLIHETVRRIRGLRLVHAQLWAVKSIDDVAQRLIDAIISTEHRRSSVVESITQALGSLRPRIELDPYTGLPGVELPLHKHSE
jgi:AAA+ ATPase superfamily predicted ATPase